MISVPRRPIESVVENMVEYNWMRNLYGAHYNIILCTTGSRITFSPANREVFT